MEGEDEVIGSEEDAEVPGDGETYTAGIVTDGEGIDA